MNATDVVAVVALVVAVMAAIAAIGTWQASIAAKNEAARSADAAERANHLIAEPLITLETDGVLLRGLEVDVTSSRDLASLHIQLRHPPTHQRPRADLALLGNIFMDGIDQERKLDDDQRGVLISNVEVGQIYHFSVLTMGDGTPRYATASFRVTATDAQGEQWILHRTIPETELDYSAMF